MIMALVGDIVGGTGNILSVGGDGILISKLAIVNLI